MASDVVVIDIETTGLDVEAHEITEVGLVRVTPDLGHEICRASMRFQIERLADASQVALDIFGWSAAEWSGAVSRATHLGLVWSFCLQARPMGHNVPFDLRFLNKAFDDIGLARPWDMALPPIDTKTYCNRRKAELGLPGAKLDHACEHFKIPRPKVHRALDDAIACWAVGRALGISEELARHA
jgi:DNA polymerase III alpha subunit (gram-positive type)